MLGSYKVSNLGYCSQCLIPSASPQIHVKPTVFLTLMVAANTVVCSVSLKISQKGVDYRQSCHTALTTVVSSSWEVWKCTSKSSYKLGFLNVF